MERIYITRSPLFNFDRCSRNETNGRFKRTCKVNYHLRFDLLMIFSMELYYLPEDIPNFDPNNPIPIEEKQVYPMFDKPERKK